MRKESLKKNLNTNGVVDDGNADNDVDMNGGAAIDADPLVIIFYNLLGIAVIYI